MPLDPMKDYSESTPEFREVETVADLPDPNGCKLGMVVFVRSPLPGAFYTCTVTDAPGNPHQWTAVGGGSSGSAAIFIFTPGAAHAGNVYGDWAEMMAVIASLPLGSLPTVRFVPPVGGPNTFSIPSAGMPAAGWEMALGSWESFLYQTGSFVVTIPDGVRIANLTTIQNGLQVECAPTTDYGVFNYTTGAAWILVVGLGAKLVNLSPGGVAGLIVTPDAGQTVVYVQNQATINTVPPPSTGPIVKGIVGPGGGDGIIGVQIAAGTGGALPDGWVEGNGNILIYQNGIEASAPLIPGWVGPAPFILNGTRAANLNYTPANLANWSGVSPENVQAALDRIAAAIGPIA